MKYFMMVCFSLSFYLFIFFIRPQEEPTTWTGYFGKVLMASTSYLPAQVTEMFNQGRAFATVRLPFSGHKNICALAMWANTVLPHYYSQCAFISQCSRVEVFVYFWWLCVFRGILTTLADPLGWFNESHHSVFPKVGALGPPTDQFTRVTFNFVE